MRRLGRAMRVSGPLSTKWRQVRSGLASSPEQLPGLSRLVAKMLKEGTRRRTSAQLAEQIEYLGADLFVGDDQGQVVMQIRALSEHLDQVMELLADMAMNPRFDEQELRRLKSRESDRLRIEYADAATLARRAFYDEIYGEHPYGVQSPAASDVEPLRSADMTALHERRVHPTGAILVIAGDIEAWSALDAVETALGGWDGDGGGEVTPPVPPLRPGPIVLADRAESVQSSVRLALPAVEQGRGRGPGGRSRRVVALAVAGPLGREGREDRSLETGAVLGRAHDHPGATRPQVVEGEEGPGGGDQLDAALPRRWRSVTLAPARPWGTE